MSPRRRSQTDGVPFVLSAGTGSCGIDPALAAVQVKRGCIQQIVRGRALPAAHAEWLERAGISTASVARTKVCFNESIVEFGSRIAVVGCAKLAPHRDAASAETDYRAGPPSWASFTGNDHELLITDDRRSLRARGTGGGITTEPVGAADAGTRARSDAPREVDVDVYERSIAPARTPLLRASVLVAILGAAGVAVYRCSTRKPAAPATAMVSDPELDCDLAAIDRELNAKGAPAVLEKIAKFESHCGLTPEYRRFHFSVMRAQHDAIAAADDAEQLLHDHAADADLWLAISEGKHASIETLRQAAALAESDAQRQEAAAALTWLERSGAISMCDDALARFVLRAQAPPPPRECPLRGRGHATLALAPDRVEGRIGKLPARVLVDPRVGTPIVSETFAARAKLDPDRDPRQYAPLHPTRTAVRGHLVVGERVLVPSIAVGATSATDLPVIVGWFDLDDIDAVVGIDYLWRFATAAADGGAVRLSQWSD